MESEREQLLTEVGSGGGGGSDNASQAPNDATGRGAAAAPSRAARKRLEDALRMRYYGLCYYIQHLSHSIVVVTNASATVEALERHLLKTLCTDIALVIVHLQASMRSIHVQPERLVDAKYKNEIIAKMEVNEKKQCFFYLLLPLLLSLFLILPAFTAFSN